MAGVGSQVLANEDAGHPVKDQNSKRIFAVVVQLLSRVRLFVTPWTAARLDSLLFSMSQSLLKLMSIESMKTSNQLIPLSSPSPPAFDLSQHQGLFQ